MSVTEAEAMNGFTAEQSAAVGRREGDLFLDAGAGSGKTSVLVERFTRAVVEDGIEPTAILTITFTEKAAAEMRDRIRERLREIGALAAARATEGAFISTIHSFCARVLRAHALTVGIDPAFTVLDELEAARLADAAFEAAIVELADTDPGGVALIAAYGVWDLRAAVQAVHRELRARGQVRPRLPAPAPAPDVDAALRAVERARDQLAAELGSLADPSPRVVETLERLERLGQVAGTADPWPGNLDALKLPGGNGAALSTPACGEYSDALAELRAAWADRWAAGIQPLLDRLLARFSEGYEERKRERSGLDFEDLELLSRDLLRGDQELRERYRDRFVRVMVDELQDTNAVQLELIDLVSAGNLFTVGDAQQSIYGFRHADVRLFERRGEQMAAVGARLTLRTNFRSRPEILEVVNRVFAQELGDGFVGLVAGRGGPAGSGPLVELLVADKQAEWAGEGLAAPWRLAEARCLARRIEELVAEGAAPADVVVLTRATTDIRVYERALEERGIPTYVIGGRGYWSHPQVVDLVAYLRLIANPRDEEALYTVLASPLVGASLDALVLLGAAGRESGRDPWWVLRDPGELLDDVPAADRELVTGFASWAAAERAAAPRLDVEVLIERVLERTGYDLAVLALPGGQRRLANVRKLMRLGRHHAAAHGPGLRGFLDLVAIRSSASAIDPDASEAPVESEALDAVRLMTIHRAKGLEFPVVAVADLGRGPRRPAGLLRVGDDGRLGVRITRPGSERRESALAYDELGEEQRVRSSAEERRLFYVAMTRARERLILSGAAKLEAWGAGNGGSPIAWLGPALVPDLSAGEGMGEDVRFSVVRPDAAGDLDDPGYACRPSDRPGQRVPAVSAPPVAKPPPSPPVTSLSYTALAAYERCGYRFYIERVLGVPPRDEPAAAVGGARAAVLTPAERGSAVHALLERLDFRRPVRPGAAAIAAAAARAPTEAEVKEIASLLARFAQTELVRRLAAATRVRREQGFGFLLGDTLITGALDVIASEAGNCALIVDYKTDRLKGPDGGSRDPEAIVVQEYATQRLIYALAAMRAGAAEVEVVHVFLEEPDRPVAARFIEAQLSELEERLAALAAGLLDQQSFAVTDTPHRGVCHGCPAEGGLCSWRLEMTRREAPDRLF